MSTISKLFSLPDNIGYRPGLRIFPFRYTKSSSMFPEKCRCLVSISLHISKNGSDLFCFLWQTFTNGFYISIPLTDLPEVDQYILYWNAHAADMTVNICCAYVPGFVQNFPCRCSRHSSNVGAPPVRVKSAELWSAWHLCRGHQGIRRMQVCSEK